MGSSPEVWPLTELPAGGGGGGAGALRLPGRVLTASYSAAASDSGQALSFSSASAVTLTLPATVPSADWFILVENIGAGALTVARNGRTIDGAAADLTLQQGQGCLIYTDGADYLTMRGLGGGVTTGQTAAISTGSIAAGGYESGSITVAKVSLLARALADDKCRLRLYSTEAGRDADLSRAEAVAPSNVGLLYEQIWGDTAPLGWDLQPIALLRNRDAPLAALIYYTVNNKLDASHTFSITLTFDKMA